MTDYNILSKVSLIYEESTDYYEFMIKLGLYGYEINNSFKEDYIIPLLCYELDNGKDSIINTKSLHKVLRFVSDYINEESGPFYYNVIPLASKLCSLMLTYPDKSIIMSCFKLMCEKIPDIMKKTYEEQKQFLKYKIN